MLTNCNFPPNFPLWTRGRHGPLAAVQTIAAECCASAPHRRKKASLSAEVFNSMPQMTEDDRMDGQISHVSLSTLPYAATSCHFMSVPLAMRLMHLHGSCCKLSVLVRSCMILYGTGRSSRVSTHHKLMAAVSWMSLQGYEGILKEKRCPRDR